MNNKERFTQAYTKHLTDVVREFPDEYPAYHGHPETIIGNLGNTVLAPVTISSIALKMIAALERGSYNKDSKAIKRTCKEIGIRYTYRAIREFYFA
jgi:thermostable 8-oxoguanine DNA glycosylase